MTMSKLTLSADKAVIRRAKKLAAANSTSVSAMFSSFILAMTRPREPQEPAGPLTRMATGLIHLPADAHDEHLLEEALAEKHGARK